MPRNSAVQKNVALYSILFSFWLASCFYFDFKLLHPIISPVNITSKIAIVLFLLSLNLFWLYGFYHLIFIIFSYVLPRHHSISPVINSFNPAVAIFYTTKDDFQEEAIVSCLNQDYQNCEIYILDDSDSSDSQKRIDGFLTGHPRIKLIRRKDKDGFKGGNLNNALRQLHSLYPYFAVCDSDTRLPQDFLSKLMPYFLSRENIGFVQANQRANPNQKSAFAKILSFNTNLHWRHYVPVKERFGFTMFYGHGAVISTKAWQEAGGFPEIATEDLAFSSVLREKGYRGIFSSEVICYEDYPDTYQRLRKRNKKWVTGTAEYLLKYFPSLMRAKGVSNVEKMDILISAGSLLLAFPFLIYIIIAGIILPFSQDLFRLNIPVYIVFPHSAADFFDYLSRIKYKIYWPVDLFVIMFITSFAQLLPVFLDFIKEPVKMARYMVLFTYLCLSTVVVSTIDFLGYFFRREAYFHVTGAQSDKESEECLLISGVEIIAGAGLIYLTCITSNLWLLTIGIALITSPLVYRYNLTSGILRFFLYLPFTVNLLILLMIARSLE